MAWIARRRAASFGGGGVGITGFGAVLSGATSSTKIPEKFFLFMCM